MPHQVVISPRADMIIVKAVAYAPPRISAQAISPSATSSGPSEVANIALYKRLSFNLKNTFQVESSSAPFMALDANKPGAINAA